MVIQTRTTLSTQRRAEILRIAKEKSKLWGEEDEA